MRISDVSSDVCPSDLKGWTKVESKGDGVFDIEYSVAGHLSHDLMFPVIEGVPTTNIFVRAILREGNQVRINAPGFSVDTGPGPSSGMMGGMAGLAAMRGGDKGLEGLDELPRLRSEEHTSELQSLMRISYAVFCLK